MRVKSYAAQSPTSPMALYEFDRRQPQAHDVEFEVLFCGVCHSDLHTVNGDWGEKPYPLAPGHEIVGRVTRIGSEVTKHKVGDMVGVGCMVNSCGTCNSCKAGLQQYCENGGTYTYGSIDPIDGSVTQGGYSQYQVTTEEFVLKIPEGLDPAEAAPLLCAGITMYSPLRHWEAGPDKKVGIVGLGGLGHMGLKYAHSFGAEVTAITTSPAKAEDAKKYGAGNVLISTDVEAMAAAAGSFDLIIDTVPVGHNPQPYVDLLRLDGALVLVGPLSPMEGFNGGSLMSPRRSIAGSNIGGIPETQEMLEYSAEHNIAPEIDIVPIEQINEVYGRLKGKDLSHRFVIDMKASFK